MSMSGRSTKRGGFSLLELLVVIGVVALLMGLLIPSLQSVLRAGRISACLSHLRSIQVAHMSYMMDNGGYFVGVGLAHGGLGNEEAAWINTLERHYGSREVLQSPLDRSPHWTAEAGGEGIPLPGTTDRFRRASYGRNNFLTPNYSPAEQPVRRLSDVNSPAATVDFMILSFHGPFAGSDHVHVENWMVPGQPMLTAEVAVQQTQINAASGVRTKWNEQQQQIVVSGGNTGALWDARSNYGFLDGSTGTFRFGELFISFERNRFDPDVSARTVTLQSLAR